MRKPRVGSLRGGRGRQPAASDDAAAPSIRRASGPHALQVELKAQGSWASRCLRRSMRGMCRRYCLGEASWMVWWAWLLQCSCWLVGAAIVVAAGMWRGAAASMMRMLEMTVMMRSWGVASGRRRHDGEACQLRGEEGCLRSPDRSDTSVKPVSCLGCCSVHPLFWSLLS